MANNLNNSTMTVALEGFYKDSKFKLFGNFPNVNGSAKRRIFGKIYQSRHIDNFEETYSSLEKHYVDLEKSLIDEVGKEKDILKARKLRQLKKQVSNIVSLFANEKVTMSLFIKELIKYMLEYRKFKSSSIKDNAKFKHKGNRGKIPFKNRTPNTPRMAKPK